MFMFGETANSILRVSEEGGRGEVNVIPAGGESVIGAGKSGPHQLWLGGDCLQFYPPQFD